MHTLVNRVLIPFINLVNVYCVPGTEPHLQTTQHPWLLMIRLVIVVSHNKVSVRLTEPDHKLRSIYSLSYLVISNTLQRYLRGSNMSIFLQMLII